jgi:Trk K+ transport system NAD-binding subunit
MAYLYRNILLMDTYELSLMLTGVNMKTPNIAEVLYGAGCDVRLVSSYSDTIFITFDREAFDYHTAVVSTIKDAESSHVDAKTISINNNELEVLMGSLAMNTEEIIRLGHEIQAEP